MSPSRAPATPSRGTASPGRAAATPSRRAASSRRGEAGPGAGTPKRDATPTRSAAAASSSNNASVTTPQRRARKAAAAPPVSDAKGSTAAKQAAQRYAPPPMSRSTSSSSESEAEEASAAESMVSQHDGRVLEKLARKMCGLPVWAWGLGGKDAAAGSVIVARAPARWCSHQPYSGLAANLMSRLLPSPRWHASQVCSLATAPGSCGIHSRMARALRSLMRHHRGPCRSTASGRCWRPRPAFPRADAPQLVTAARQARPAAHSTVGGAPPLACGGGGGAAHAAGTGCRAGWGWWLGCGGSRCCSCGGRAGG